MENLVVEHKDAIKGGIINLLVAAVLAAVLIVAADQFVMSVGTAILLVALVFEAAIFEALMAAAAFIRAFSKEILHPEGVDVVNVFGTKTYSWKNLQRFEILWDYEGKRMVKKEEIDAPYILLKFENPKKKLRIDYREDVDQCIRVNYGQPHVDNWTNIGK